MLFFLCRSLDTGREKSPAGWGGAAGMLRLGSGGRPGSEDRVGLLGAAWGGEGASGWENRHSRATHSGGRGARAAVGRGALRFQGRSPSWAGGRGWAWLRERVAGEVVSGAQVTGLGIWGPLFPRAVDSQCHLTPIPVSTCVRCVRMHAPYVQSLGTIRSIPGDGS